MSAEILPQVVSWGYDISVITEFPKDRNLASASQVIEADSRNPAAALAAAHTLAENGIRFDGVLSLCWDCAISVATIAENFGLHSVSLDTARGATDKVLRSQLFERAGVPAPRYAEVHSLEELQQVVQEFIFPLVLKPIDRSSSKGVIKVVSADEIESAYAYALTFSSVKTLLVNEFVQGTEHSTEGLMIDGIFHPTAISDRLFQYEDRNTFVEIGDIMPTLLSDEIVEEAFAATEKAALAVGITNGVAKGDLIYVPGCGILIFEVTARLGGPRFGTEMVPLSNGTNILKAAIQQALGEEIDRTLLQPRYSRGMVNRSIFPPPGRVISIRGLSEAQSLPGFYDFKWWMPEGLEVGSVIKPYEYGCGDVGYFIAAGGSREEAIAHADNIEHTIRIETKKE